MAARHIVVPAVVVALAAGLYFYRGGEAPIVDLPDDVRTCTDNLRAIYRGLGEYHQREGHLPAASGNAFLAALVVEGVWPDDAESRARLTCPGRGAEPVPAGLDLRSPDLPPSASAYAARDNLGHPLAKFPSGGSELEPLVACDNAHGMNHDGRMNVLYSDGQVRTFVIAQEIEAGRLPAGTTTIPVGPGSPIEDLRPLVGDAP